MQSAGQGTITRLANACSDCRERKVKCSGDAPCTNCQRLRKTCSYLPSRRGKRPRTGSGALRNLNRSQNQEKPPDTARFYVPEHALPLTPSQFSSGTCDDNQSRKAASSLGYPTQSSTQTTDGESENLEAPSASADYPYQPFRGLTDLLSPVELASHRSPSSDAPQNGGNNEEIGGIADGEESVIPLEKINWEHHGPWSWASICSRPGVRWVCQKTNSHEFGQISSEFMKNWTRGLKMNRFQSLTVKCPEPERELAWKYVGAFFDQSHEAVFGIPHRPTFETRLRAHYDTFRPAQAEDPSWFALRNVVYAVGCRCLLANDSSISFVQADAQAAPYFRTALSVFSEIIFGHSGLTAVQALVVMTFYAGSLASPMLEYPLCKNAVQLAQAKGLHREPSGSWGLSISDVLTRNWLWWAIYCQEKQIALRSGRPSSIDDDDISTPIPTSAPPGSIIDVEIFTLTIRHAQICSQILSRITSVRASKQSCAQAIDIVHDIHTKLQNLLESIPPDLNFGNRKAQDCAIPPQRMSGCYLQLGIHTSLMAIYVIFFYPWISFRFGNESEPVFQNLAVSSSNTIANSARRIILMLRFLKTDITTPAWLAFFYPTYAYINLFIYVLKYPHLPTVMGDLALLDICTGHFGQIDHITNSEVSLHFPREITALCSRVVKAKKDPRKETCTVPESPHGENSALASPRPENWQDEGYYAHRRNLFLLPDNMYSLVPDDMIQSDPFDAMNFDVESWNIASSINVTSNLNTAFGGSGGEQ